VLIGSVGIIHSDEWDSASEHFHGHTHTPVRDDHVGLIVVGLQGGGEAEEPSMSRLVAPEPDLHQHVQVWPPGAYLVHSLDK
jgi:hypothetical protein